MKKALSLLGCLALLLSVGAGCAATAPASETNPFDSM